MTKQVKTLTERLQDMHQKLLKNRIILIDGILTESAGVQIEQILTELSQTEGKIDLYINSSGGSANAFLYICSVIKKIKNTISTICLEESSAGAVVLLSSGTKGMRFALPHSKISLCQNLWIKDENNTDLEIAGKAIVEIENSIISVLEENTDINKDRLKKLISSESVLIAQEAKELGVIDNIIG